MKNCRKKKSWFSFAFTFPFLMLTIWCLHNKSNDTPVIQPSEPTEPNQQLNIPSALLLLFLSFPVITDTYRAENFLFICFFFISFIRKAYTITSTTSAFIAIAITITMPPKPKQNTEKFLSAFLIISFPIDNI